MEISPHSFISRRGGFHRTSRPHLPSRDRATGPGGGGVQHLPNVSFCAAHILGIRWAISAPKPKCLILLAPRRGFEPLFPA